MIELKTLPDRDEWTVSSSVDSKSITVTNNKAYGKLIITVEDNVAGTIADLYLSKDDLHNLKLVIESVLDGHSEVTVNGGFE